MIKLLGKQVVYLLLGVILLVHVLILTKLIYFPYPELFIYPYLTNHGLKPYSQILDQHFPGLMFLPVNFNNLGMDTPEAARWWSIAIVLIIHLMLFFISNKIFKSKSKAILVNILYLIWQPFFEGWMLWIDNFLPILLLPAYYALSKRRYLLTGLLVGLGIVFKQVLIPLGGLLFIYLVWEQRSAKVVSKYLFGLVLPIILMAVYLGIIGVLADFWYWTITFNLTVYAKESKTLTPSFAHILRIVFVFGISLLVLLTNNFLLKEKRRTVLLLIFLIGSLAGAVDRFDFIHFQPALPFALLATVYGVERLSRIGRFGIGIAYILLTVWWLNIFYQGHLGNKVFFFDNQTKTVAAKIKFYTHPGEKIFVLGAPPQLYQMSDTLPAGHIFVFQFPWFYKVAENKILAGIIRDKPNIVVLDQSVEIEGKKITEFAKDIDQYLEGYYQKVESIGTTDILRKR